MDNFDDNEIVAHQQPLSRVDTLQALEISNREAVSATVHSTLTGGAFQTGFALYLGASSFWVGVLSSFPTLAGLSQIFASLMIERRGERRVFTAVTSGIGRILWLPILLIPFLLPASIRFSAFILLLLVSSVSLSMSGPAFTSWISDLVPPESRGRYFGRRNMLVGLTTTVVSLPAAWFLDQAVKYHRFSQALGFAGLFLVAVVGGIVSYILLNRQAEPPMLRSDHQVSMSLAGLKEFYKAPFADKPFRKLMFFNSIFAAAQFFAAPFYVVYALQELQLNYVWIQVFATIAGISGMLAMPFWGYLSDKYGNRPILAISACGVGMLPLFWVFTDRHMPGISLALIFTNNILAGFFWAGAGLSQFNMLIGSTPSERKSVYVGAMAAVTGLAGGIAPIVGGALITALEPVHIHFLTWTFGHFQLVFIMNSCIRFLILFAFQRVEDPGSTSARDVITQLSSARVGTWVQMRRLQNAPNEQGRMRAAHALRSARTALAVEELIAALDDPSHHVREEAAEALGEIADARAIPALRDHLLDSASGIVAECAEALGRIGDSSGVEPLAYLLREGIIQDRIVAAKALGRIGNEASEASLLGVLGSPEGEPEAILEACLLALPARNDRSIISITQQFMDHKARGVRLAAVRTAGDIGAVELASALHALLAREEDNSVVPQIAVSLAMTGAPDAVGPLLNCMQRVESPIARRQILNAVGIVLGIDEVFYPFLSMERSAREEAMQRMMREFGRSNAGNANLELSDRRRHARLDRATGMMMREDYAGSLKSLSRLLPETNDLAGKQVFEFVLDSANRGPITQEEFALAVIAGFKPGAP